MCRTIAFLLAFLIIIPLTAQTIRKEMTAIRSTDKITIDGRLEEPGWMQAPPAGDFTTYSPTMGQPATQKSEVRIIYDNRAVYFGAMLYDAAPDSIMRELTKRDNFGSANIDKFRITLNPYNDGQNLFHFEVTAANVQGDYKKGATEMEHDGGFGHGDYSWNAVWKSAVRITEEGWTLEVEIPYAALRFPRQDIQTWGINFQRTVRRSREITTWNPVDRSFSEDDQVGILNGIRSIRAPLRLELYPFAAAYYEIAPEASGFSWAGGMDLKYGINEAYTLDMTLIPDFGQRKSDKIILNLTPYEVKYSENRQFFTEGMELFNKSDLFYSRRIGKQPINYYDAWNAVDDGETLLENPSEAKLINATKISGRNSRNLGIGFFNAMTANTYATIQTGDGDTRKYLTDPFTNYNMIVADQIIGRNSYVNFSNTNAFTPSTTRMANVSSVTTRLMDRNNRYGINGSVAGDVIWDSLKGKPSTGYSATIGLGKYGGSFTYGYNLALVNDTYNPNDMGYLKRNNYINHDLSLSYRVLEPVWIFNSINGSLGFQYSEIYNPRAYYGLTGNLSAHFLFLDYSDFRLSLEGSPFVTHDYYEPRVEGRFFESPAYYYLSLRGSSDYRRKLAFDAGLGFWDNLMNEHGYEGNFGPRVRFNDRFTIYPSIAFSQKYNDRGFASLPNPDSIFFGRRDVRTITNSISGSYVFNNKMALSLVFRHYWSEVNYLQYYLLNEDGTLADYPDYPGNGDLNFNFFTIDLEYAWNFAPGSYLTAVWKNNISQSKAVDNELFLSYWDNLHNTILAPQTNSFSIKASYYLDYQKFIRKPVP